MSDSVAWYLIININIFSIQFSFNKSVVILLASVFLNYVIKIELN